ncbi:hypothetical protein C0993_012646 [Termitomyces sp. T159_Od127]|nr:hypothetical protein C0993_012646 [Termitomyces sp. T159_Od127]
MNYALSPIICAVGFIASDSASAPALVVSTLLSHHPIVEAILEAGESSDNLGVEFNNPAPQLSAAAADAYMRSLSYFQGPTSMAVLCSFSPPTSGAPPSAIYSSPVQLLAPTLSLPFLARPAYPPPAARVSTNTFMISWEALMDLLHCYSAGVAHLIPQAQDLLPPTFPLTSHATLFKGSPPPILATSSLGYPPPASFMLHTTSCPLTTLPPVASSLAPLLGLSGSCPLLAAPPELATELDPNIFVYNASLMRGGLHMSHLTSSPMLPVIVL